MRRTRSAPHVTSLSRTAGSRRLNPEIEPSQAAKVIEVAGLYVTPGLVDIHVHVYAGTGERGSYAGDNSVYPDGFSFRSGVTTMVDAGSSGWRNFPDFKDRIIDRSQTRVLAFLNIVGNGMRGGKFEQDLADMEAKPSAEMALRHKRRDRRDQNGALHRARSGRRSSGASRQGRSQRFPLWWISAGHRQSARWRSRSPAKLRPGRHLYARVFRPAGRARYVDRPPQPGSPRGAQTGRYLRRRAWRREFRLARRGTGNQGGLPARFHLDRPAYRQHERRHEGHAECDEQVSGSGAFARRRHRPLDLEPGARDQARGAGQPVGRVARQTWRCFGWRRGISATWTCMAPA